MKQPDIFLNVETMYDGSSFPLIQGRKGKIFL